MNSSANWSWTCRTVLPVLVLSVMLGCEKSDPEVSFLKLQLQPVMSDLSTIPVEHGEKAKHVVLHLTQESIQQSAAISIALPLSNLNLDSLALLSMGGLLDGPVKLAWFVMSKEEGGKVLFADSSAFVVDKTPPQLELLCQGRLVVAGDQIPADSSAVHFMTQGVMDGDSVWMNHAPATGGESVELPLTRVGEQWEGWLPLAGQSSQVLTLNARDAAGNSLAQPLEFRLLVSEKPVVFTARIAPATLSLKAGESAQVVLSGTKEAGGELFINGQPANGVAAAAGKWSVKLPVKREGKATQMDFKVELKLQGSLRAGQNLRLSFETELPKDAAQKFDMRATPLELSLTEGEEGTIQFSGTKSPGSTVTVNGSPVASVKAEESAFTFTQNVSGNGSGNRESRTFAIGMVVGGKEVQKRQVAIAIVHEKGAPKDNIRALYNEKDMASLMSYELKGEYKKADAGAESSALEAIFSRLTLVVFNSVTHKGYSGIRQLYDVAALMNFAPAYTTYEIANNAPMLYLYEGVIISRNDQAVVDAFLKNTNDAVLSRLFVSRQYPEKPGKRDDTNMLKARLYEHVLDMMTKADRMRADPELPSYLKISGSEAWKKRRTEIRSQMKNNLVILYRSMPGHEDDADRIENL